MLENLFKQRGHQIKDIKMSGPNMTQWGEQMGGYLNLWHAITLILEEHAIGAKSALIDSGDVRNNFDFGQDVASNAQG